MARLVAVLSLIVILFVTLPSLGQITDVTDTTSTPIPGAGHDYVKMLNESVNPANGSISLRIQVPTPPGRRLSLPFAFAYDSNSAAHLISLNDGAGGIGWADNFEYLGRGGWSYSIPVFVNLNGHGISGRKIRQVHLLQQLRFSGRIRWSPLPLSFHRRHPEHLSVRDADSPDPSA